MNKSYKYIGGLNKNYSNKDSIAFVPVHIS